MKSHENFRDHRPVDSLSGAVDSIIMRGAVPEILRGAAVGRPF